MDQATARKLAKEMCDEGTGAIYIATTVCAARGQWEQGPDANKWGVLCTGLPMKVVTEVPVEFQDRFV